MTFEQVQVAATAFKNAGTRGDPYESMIDEGVPKAIEWLRKQAGM